MVGCASLPPPASRCASPEAFAATFARTASAPDRAALEAFARGQRPDRGRRDRAIESAAVAYAEACALPRAIELTRDLVAFPTVGLPTTNPAFAAMRVYLERLAERDGFELRKFGAEEVFEVVYGKGDPALGFVMHGDVVAVKDWTTNSTSATFRSPDWTHLPFHAEIFGRRLFGRGSEDDKGPIAAAIVALETLSGFGLRPRGEIRVIIGNGEESDWDGMVAYARGGRVHPPHVISVDASFPVVIAESGFVDFGLSFTTPPGEHKQAHVVRAEAGLFLTQVPGSGELELEPADGEELGQLLVRAQAAATSATNALGAAFRAEVTSTQHSVLIKTFGDAVHSSVAEEGKNALWLLAEIAAALDLAPDAAGQALRVIHERFVGDHHGQRLGLSYSHALMGELLVAPTLLRTAPGSASLRVNMRRPAGRSSDEFRASLEAALSSLGAIAPTVQMASDSWVGEPAVADTQGKLVPTLLEIFRRRANDPGATGVAIRGGTYARLFPGAVSFGPSLPGRPYRGHAPDESIELEALELMVPALVEASLALAFPEP